MILLESGCRWFWRWRTEFRRVTQVLLRTPFKSMSKALQIRKAVPDFKGEKKEKKLYSNLRQQPERQKL